MEISKKESEGIKRFVEDPNNIAKMTDLATRYYEVTRSNWFLPDRLVKKVKISLIDSIKNLEILVLFNLCVWKLDYDKGKEIKKYKITVSKAHKLNYLRNIKGQVEIELKEIDSQILELENGP